MAIPRVPRPAKFLYETGLLFEINREVLHPLGLALETVVNEETGEVEMGCLQDFRADPEGVVFDDAALKEGTAKILKFMREEGQERIASRKKGLGYVIQPLPDHD